jgi:antirestriction protein ArdC
MYTPEDALNSAKNSESLANYPAIFAGFAAKGLTDIRPRENVFTYKAWQALGRQVRKGEKGVSVCTWLTVTKDGQQTTIPRKSTVFHIQPNRPSRSIKNEACRIRPHTKRTF